MARKRALSEEILLDEEFNSLSIEAQNLFLRMLSVSDDCGVVPADQYRLERIANLPAALKKKLNAFLHEIVAVGLGRVIEYGGRPFFAFKLDPFLEHQGHILNKRKRSEYLKMSTEEYDSGNFPDYPGFSCSKTKNPNPGVESREKRVESREQKVESRKQKETELPPIPEKLLAIPGFKEKWGEWLEYRKVEKREPVTPRGAKEQFEKLCGFDDPIGSIRDSIAGGWKGLFPVKSTSPHRHRDSPNHGGVKSEPGKYANVAKGGANHA